MVLSPRTYQFLVGVFASVGSVLYGYDLGVIAEVVGCDDYLSKFNPSSTENGVVVSLFTGGAFFGAFFAGPVGDMLGRRWTIFLGAIIFLLGGSLQTAARTIHYLYAGRAIAGLGVGFLVMIIRHPDSDVVSRPNGVTCTLELTFSVPTAVYQGEIAHPSIRGRVTALQQFMLGIGSFVAGWISYGTFSIGGSKEWRIPLGIQLVPALILALLILLFPESPRWLLDNGKEEEGLDTLAKLHANGDRQDAWVRAEFAQIQESITFEHEHAAKTYAELFRNRSSFRRLFLACALQASVQMTGVSAIQYFSIDIYSQVGIEGQDALKYQAINNILALIAQASCILFIDRLGRRWPLICGNLINCLMFMIATILIAQFPPETNKSGGAGWGFIVVTWLYNISFSATCGPLSWIIPAEIFDTHTRSKGVSIATMTSFAFNTMIGQVTDIAINNTHWRYYLLFVICNFTNAVFFYLLLPETKKLPLEEMNYLFTNAPWIVPGTDRSAYTMDMAADLERRAGELQEKGAVAENAEHA
ncbi:High-affinity glucose transporter [Pleurostoma richardsiae]|uniref:High-affinity glucose transporter n=1 Tax=Pleurostoma richardsiae TaxID=41990 RepID=A0AA38RT43_9PEZI|nr:High-affinity glucose transporter [Pleurostoma richardsiae]